MLRTVVLSLLVLAGTPVVVNAAQGDLAALREELARMRERLAELEDLRQRVDELEAEVAAAEADRIAEKEAVTEPRTAGTDEQTLKIGGALRFNYFWKDFDESVRTKRGDVGLDLFRLNVEGKQRNIEVSAEYRWYSFMDTIHHGWLGYDFGEPGRVELGITQVPFGILPYASHNFWFGVPYYVGLADDYDAGVRYQRTDGPWDVQLGFFKNAELGSPADLERYSYDIVSTGPDRNEETNQFNARVAYTFGPRTGCDREFGLSGQWGELYNQDTRDTGHHWAAAAHMDSRCGRWNVQVEAGRYGYDPRNPPGVSDATVTVGAFGASHVIAARGTFAVANVAYNIPVRGGTVDLLTCYNDFSVLHKDDERFDNSYLNTTGCGIGIGPTFTYVDIIRAKNMVFFGDGSLAGGDGGGGWDTRLNLNLGYYF